MPQCFKSYKQKSEIYPIFATVYSNIEHRAFPDKLNRQINKPCAENLSFGVAAISEDISWDFNTVDIQK